MTTVARKGPAAFEPHPSRLARDHPDRQAILDAHSAALAAGVTGYLDPSSGLYVLTAQFHLDRGACCEHSCRHCPYVDDPS